MIRFQSCSLSLSVCHLLTNLRETTTIDHVGRIFMSVVVWATRESSPEYPTASSKTAKLQTRTSHQIETAILIPPLQHASNANLHTFSTGCPPNSETVFIICSNYGPLFFFCFHGNASYSIAWLFTPHRDLFQVGAHLQCHLLR